VKNKSIKVLISTGSEDFGRCGIATHRCCCLWPVPIKPAVENLITHLHRQAIRHISLCCNSNCTVSKEEIAVPKDMQLDIITETLPTGSAGAIRRAVDERTCSQIIVLPATALNVPKITALVKEHEKTKAGLTVVLNPPSTPGRPLSRATGIYICQPKILQYIPQQGYYDIKEGLIPALIQNGLKVSTVTLSRPVDSFRNYPQYMQTINALLQTAGKKTFDLPVYRKNSFQTLWASSESKIAPTAGIYGPVVVLDGAVIKENALIFGPVVIGRNCIIAENALVVNSVLWEGCRIGKDCELRNCLLDKNVSVAKNLIVEDTAIPFKETGPVHKTVEKISELISTKTNGIVQAVLSSGRLGKNLTFLTNRKILAILSAVTIAAALIWSYWPQITELMKIWQRSDEYSSGLLVPFLAVYVLWSRREKIARCQLKPALWGIVALVLAQAVRFFGLFFMYGSAERISLVLTIAALVLLLCGRQFFKKVFTILVFLGLMLPLPRSVHNTVMLPLQSWATSSAVFCLEVLGYNVIREGNIIHLNGTSVAVAEACNGLRMLMAFFVISGLVVLLVRRSWWEKLLVLISSVPIGLVCNSFRLTVTAIAFSNLNGKHWEKIFHDFGGYAMMPVALAMVVLELWLIQKITRAPVEKQIIVASENTKKI